MPHHKAKKSGKSTYSKATTYTKQNNTKLKKPTSRKPAQLKWSSFETTPRRTLRGASRATPAMTRTASV